ncbi:HAMP domain-containing sensor histidine kinase [Bacillus suaedae]|uniref:histidine kinase n=1 Tax=Halalkalibacter suaedae TaxID=2822140 RepID=A0A941APU3_9BACI|nr:HAMP domain-containing sensor histidine kinase [Bacillus suaedae]MBP3951882.1 HAMP domain-containing protein [Bacillus suaedae]
MKIRTWLMVTYLIVMFLPLAAAYGFFLLVQEWDQSKRLADMFELNEQIRTIEDHLQSRSLYQVQPKEEIEKQLPEETKRAGVTIQLYRSDGVLVYHSDDDYQTLQQVDRSQLMKNLYNYELSYQFLSVKKPIYEDQQIHGIYEIQMDRSDWVDGVKERRTMMIASLMILFTALYGAVIILLQRKLNRPLKQLMNGMSSFAAMQKPIHFKQKKNDEIGQLMRHFEQMQEQIVNAQQAAKKEQEEKQLMMASFSHDIKTPLTALQTYAEALQDESNLTPAERKEYLQILKNKSSHLKGIIEDLTTYAKLQSSQYDIELPEVDAEEFFDMLFEGYDELARQQGILLQKHAVISGTCFMNDQQMVRYLDNLMSNALRYTPTGSMIGLAVINAGEELPEWIFEEARSQLEQFHEDHALLIVQNDGPKIHDLEAVFTPFYQEEDARTFEQAKHTGLGLSIAKRIAEKHNGEMKLSSFNGKGTLITMRFKQKRT